MIILIQKSNTHELGKQIKSNRVLIVKEQSR